MTACLYIRSQGLPLLLSDTLVTREGLDLETLPVPGALVRYSNPANIKTVELYRKLYLFGNHYAVACAGDGERIGEFLTETAELASASTDYTALKVIDDVLLKYEKHVEAIVCYQNGTEACTLAPAGSMHDLAPDTEFWVSGSGGNDLAALVRHDFDRFDRSRLNALSPPDLIRNVAGRVGSRMIGNELLYGHGRDWGGIAEWATFNFAFNRWEYSPPNLHGFVLGVPLPGRRFTLEQSRYWYCYNNDAELGSSAVLGMRLTEQPYMVQWTLEDVLSYELASGRTRDWVGWKPAEIVVQLFPYGKRELGSFFSMTGVLPELKFDIQEKQVVVGIEQSRIDTWGREAAAGWRREYVPMTSLTDAQMEDAFEAAMNDGWSN